MQEYLRSIESPAPLAVFGRYYKVGRERLGLTQAQVVERLALRDSSYADRDVSWVSRVESGTVPRLSREAIDDLTVALGCGRRERVAFLIAAGFWPVPGPIPTGWGACRRHADRILRATEDSQDPGLPGRVAHTASAAYRVVHLPGGRSRVRTRSA